MTMDNPYMECGKWYWYDEVEHPSQPFDTKEEAEEDLKKYCEWFASQE